MRSWKWRAVRWSAALAQGGTTFGVLQGLGLLNFANLFTSLLATWLSVLVTVLLGGDATDLVRNL